MWENSFPFCLEVPGISPLELPCSWDPLSSRHVPRGRPSAHRLHKLLSSLTHLSRAAKYVHQDIKSAEPSKHFCWNRRANNLWALQLCLLLSGWLVERKCTHNYLIPLKQRQMTAENSQAQQFEHRKILNSHRNESWSLLCGQLLPQPLLFWLHQHHSSDIQPAPENGILDNEELPDFPKYH